MANPNARRLRKTLTDAEQALWHALRDRQVDGCRFRRQVPIGKYIVDFACLDKGLIAEVDGGQHEINQADDAIRDAWLTKEGYRVLRFWNNDVLTNAKVFCRELWKRWRLMSDTEPVTPIPPFPPQGGRSLPSRLMCVVSP